MNSFSFAILCNKVVFSGLAGCAVLDFTDFIDCHLFAYFFFDFTDNFFHFWLVIVIGWNYMHFMGFWPSYFDLLH